jgi:hypothetical protein
MPDPNQLPPRHSAGRKTLLKRKTKPLWKNNYIHISEAQNTHTITVGQSVTERNYNV